MNVKQALEPCRKKRDQQKLGRPIFRIKPTVRVSNLEKFEPQHIFLGLYNRSEHGDNNLKPRGNLFRLEVVGAFLADSEITLDRWESVCARIVTDPKAMSEYYREEGLEKFSTEDVRSLLSLDALFLALFLCKYFERDWFPNRWPSATIVLAEGDRSFLNSLFHDIVKLENQIPLELLGNAFSYLSEIAPQKREENGQSSSNGGDSVKPETMLRKICIDVVAAFRSLVPNSDMKWRKKLNDNLEPGFPDKCKHLLHCLHYAIVSVVTLKQTQASATASVNPSVRNSHVRILDAAVAPATQLVKAGIKIRGHEGFGVTFEKHLLGATLSLPKVCYFGHNCDQVWRNLLAFEDEYVNGYPFISYLNFMDDLIDSEDDVEILRAGKHPVFVNMKVASTADVVRMFNTITKDHHVRSYEHPVRHEISEYYRNRYRQMWFEFKTTNLGKPWLVASLVAAILLLVFTVLQTVFTILTYMDTV